MNRARLCEAYFWNCPDCGKLNFTASEITEADASSREMLLYEYGIEDASPGKWVVFPEYVQCQSCMRTFEAVREYVDY